MKDEVIKLENIQAELLKFENDIYRHHKCLNREVAFSAMIIKKTNDILEASKHALKNYLITIQISLLRLMCDNCLAIEGAIVLGLEKYINMLNNNEHVSNIMIDEEQNMSDGYLKKLVAKNYKGFDKLYNFACESVHFSKQALGSTFIDNDGKISINVKPGNKEMKDEMIQNNKQLITLCKVILDMLKRICL